MSRRAAKQKGQSRSPTPGGIASSSSSSPPPLDPPTPALDSQSLRMSYRIGRGEQGVLTFEPYKSILLPHWRFKTAPIARRSSRILKSVFDSYVARGDFVGADMSRKFIQMGMTRARRYANYAGGRKYVRAGGDSGDKGRVQLEKSRGHEGKEEKQKASEIFEVVWRECRDDVEYARLRREFQDEQRIWDKEFNKGGNNKVNVQMERRVKVQERDGGCDENG